MPNPYGAPEITVQEIDVKRQAGEEFLWLDVREQAEVRAVHINDDRVVVLPLSELAERQLEALPAKAQSKETEIVVFCHHGVRSAQVTAWLLQQGWTNVRSMAGGVDAWAQTIDPSIGTY